MTVPRAPLFLYALALLWHLAWASMSHAPWDWDPSYYLGVARHIAAGEGAVTDAVWNLGWLPPTLRHPADLHWMPLPSRWLVPFLALPLPPWRAAQLGTVLIGAAWAPLAWAQARAWGRSEGVAVVAGIGGALAGGYVRYLTLPDSIALYGTVGALAVHATSTRRMGPALVALALAAWSRTDGLLLSLALATAWQGRARLVIAAAGPLAALVWAVRNRIVAGDGATLLRLRALQALDPTAWLTLTPPEPAGLWTRLVFLGDHLGALGRTWVAVTLALPVPFLVFALLRSWGSRRRADGAGAAWPSIRAVLLYGVGMPPLLYVAAPAVAFEGSVFRSLAALWPALSALAMSGAADVTRRYHPAFIPGLLLVALAGMGVAAGTAPGRFPEPLPDCEALDVVGAPGGAAVLSYDPIGLSTRCGRPGVILGRTMTPPDIESLAARYSISWVLTAPVGYASWTLEADAFEVAGWVRRGERVWERTGPATGQGPGMQVSE